MDSPSSTPILHLPNDIISHLITFLDVMDAVRLALTCRTLSQSSPLKTSPPLRVLTPRFFVGDYLEPPRKATDIDIPPYTNTNSIVIQVLWKDQGYGWSKGRLFLLAFPSLAMEQSKRKRQVDSFDSGRLVQSSCVVQHAPSRVSLIWKPQPGKRYSVWYEIGSGGGHELEFVSDMVQYIVTWNTAVAPS